MDVIGTHDPYADLHPQNPPRVQISLRTIDQLQPTYPPTVIDGLLRQTEIILMGGQAKRWKSWARADLLYCIANGFKWLKFPCIQGLIVHFDFELLEADLRQRFELIQQSYEAEGLKGSLDNLRFVPLRGISFGLGDLESLPEQLCNQKLTVFSLDPVYRLLGGKSESDQAAVCEVLTKFLSLGHNLKVAVALLQHFAKGDASQKEAQDRYSGSGVWSRFPDTLMTFTDLEDENCFSCEFQCRSFEPVESFGVRWKFPRFRMDEELDPQKLKVRAGRPKESTAEQLCALLRADESLSYSDFLRRANEILHISEATFKRRLKQAKEARLIYLSPTDNGYGLTPNYLQRNGSYG